MDFSRISQPSLLLKKKRIPSGLSPLVEGERGSLRQWLFTWRWLKTICQDLIPGDADLIDLSLEVLVMVDLVVTK